MSSGKQGQERSFWDTKTQQFHGGQDWKMCGDRFVEDFSVTTNGLGTPVKALEAAADSLKTCDHYPPADQEPARSSLAQFLWPDTHDRNHGRLILGNGASELIDLVIRQAPGETWKPGPWSVQYKEYERSAKTSGRRILEASTEERASLVCLVNPCNPTGDYLTWEEVVAWIRQHALPGAVVIVDESMQLWHSPGFREDSLASHPDLASTLLAEDGLQLYVIHSWTKIWSCTGLRLGSVVTPSAQHTQALRRVQVPWSVNTPALAFLDAVVRDTEYMNQTWELTPVWRVQLIDRLVDLSSRLPGPAWEMHGKPFLSWVWVDVKEESLADRLVHLAREAGVPVRSGRPGYEQPTFVRVAVRESGKVDHLIQAWESLLN
ncbi:pyridoxal phosphate-dependent transferase [Piptocephalis cylindrospora]|uniref:Pyridoxal phosphate-dependent transferase n=1 Tax=Piptocephalis cylindrospora TaxID=1907219 RepID=A0A4P9XYS7_9FUNG|nr:pyridoxal phosphate-dependent transferase [Piptocephalis cylindrospora]|eukprot:RKP11596.1 pyridoxal phosphate-dependent transferase [Piptocephalis cylindrospora]